MRLPQVYLSHFIRIHMEYRKLTSIEVSMLESRGCTAENWGEVLVAEDFNTESCRNVSFSGTVKLGAFKRRFTLCGGLSVKSGIYDTDIHNCTVGNDVYIRRTGNYIANYEIGDDAFIENTECICATGNSTFGIGTEVSVLNETGGREVPIYERLSAQLAYLTAMYRHNPPLVNALSKLIKKHADSQRKSMGRIGSHARIVNAGIITDVNIGDYAVIEGAAKLVDGTIAGSQADPVYIGSNVMAEHFIIASGAHVEDSVVLVNAFVGQACHLSHLFSAHDSLFFANCTCENGEAAAIFAGPYTVTMHKSSLLIAGMFSFLNAGSGSNQSNHMYKLGPIHQGVVERGSKTTSDSYILWPARIGAFSLVMGRHVNHPDTSALPFSYLIESHGTSMLVPGVNIKSVGTIRDARKWPKRDKRAAGEEKLDAINFNLLSPYTISKMMDGIDLLNALEQTIGVTAEHYSYHSMTIEARALRKGREYYNMAIDKFFGNSVIHRLKDIDLKDMNAVKERMKPSSEAGAGEWTDISGMIAPVSCIDKLCSDISDGTLVTLPEIEADIKAIAAAYYDMEWTWVADNFARWYGKDVTEVSAEDLLAIANRWQNSVVALDKMLYNDAKKEFSLTSRIGFGADGSDECQAADFEQVRGEFDSDPFVCMVVDHIRNKSALADDFRERLGAK